MEHLLLEVWYSFSVISFSASITLARYIVTWKVASLRNNLLSMATISEAILDIAGMGAELPMAVAIDTELFAAI